MSTNFAKFDQMFDVEGLKKDVAEAADRNYPTDPVPHGNYEVRIDKLELTESKSSGKPMVSCWFKIVAGEHENRLLFMNQVITLGFQIHIVKEFLQSLESGLQITFDSYAQFGNLLMDVAEAIDGKHEYALKYGENKGFDTFEITEVFDL